MIERVLGVIQLDVATFEEIEADTTATGQAAGVVAIAAILSAIGGSLWAGYAGGSVGGSFLVRLVGAFLGWIIWSALTYWVGTTLFDGKSDLGQMLRVIGFAYAPQALGIIPCLGALIGAIWSLVAGFVAVRQGLDLDNTKAFLTIVVGFLAYIALSLILSLFVAGPASMMG